MAMTNRCFPIMRPLLAVRLRACCVAVALVLVSVNAAETKESSLIGSTREQVLARRGEPKSQVVAGNREILFFSRERVVLENNVVVEIELLSAEQPRRQTPPIAAVESTVPAPAPTAPPELKPTLPPG